MSRMVRVVIPGILYHVTHRGNRRADVFYTPADRENYLCDPARCAAAGLELWGYCLMSNHVHLLAVPRTLEALGRTLHPARRGPKPASRLPPRPPMFRWICSIRIPSNSYPRYPDDWVIFVDSNGGQFSIGDMLITKN